MDDITGKISQLLSDPQAMEQIMNLTSLFSPSNEEATTQPSEPIKPQKPVLPSFSDDTMKTVMKIMPLLSNIRQDDDTTRLLNALRPFLCEERCKKLDEAEKILQLIKVLPVIKQLNF